ncbi:hypothetical protein [Paenirhodobacter populi]|uniref:Uncharacterized protein n=1 Tax=Paenirhodobacter populi TaxID=2306993 RepID=A0A443K172_9RHOB|nr:hypothetical protein [Sinirhodobacter populi]RWR04662.1 hypothetical protein D2T32_18940 [Sinirhodobacter populi]RWR26506.1 hypothetical protein D2T31_19615 [Sinirhodobacter populi]
MLRLLGPAIIACILPAMAQAREFSFAGIELGTSCDEAERILSGAHAITAETRSGITAGRMFRLRAGAMGVDFVKSGTVICSPGFELVEGIELIIDKDSAGTVADLLGKEFREQSRNLPRLGSGYASYVSESGKTSAQIRYVHVSFDARVQMTTQFFDELLDHANREEEKEQQRMLKDAF